MARKIYYNRTNTCDNIKDDGIICGENLRPHYANREYDKEGNWTGRWLCKNCYYKKDYKRPNGYNKTECNSSSGKEDIFEIKDVKNLNINGNIYEKGTLGWLREQQKIKAKKVGFDSVDNWLKWKADPFNILEKKYGNEFAFWARQNKGKVPDAWLNAGCTTKQEYEDLNAKKLGFKNEAERYRECNRIYNWKTRSEPIEFNENCTLNFGEYIGEELFKVFLEDVVFGHVKKKEKGGGDEGIDFVCKNVKQEFIDKYPYLKLERDKEYMVQLAMRCLHNYKWPFDIKYSKADYFILCAWDNRKSLEPLHIWMFHKYDIVRGRKFWRRGTFAITNKLKYLKKFDQYELKDKLEKLKDQWNKLKEEL